MKLLSFFDELEKIAAKVPYMHGTHQRFPELVPGVGKAIAANDPNKRAVYVAGKRRGATPSIEAFARSATKARGGEPVIAFGKIDTLKGWEPRTLTAWGKKNVGSIDDMMHFVDQLDNKALSKAKRGLAWEKVNRGVGAWRNVDVSAKLKPAFYKMVKKLLRK